MAAGETTSILILRAVETRMTSQDMRELSFHEEKARQVSEFQILSSVLVGDTEDKEILQAEHPSTALLLPFSTSPLLPQVSEMTVLNEL